MHLYMDIDICFNCAVCVCVLTQFYNGIENTYIPGTAFNLLILNNIFLVTQLFLIFWVASTAIFILCGSVHSGVISACHHCNSCMVITFW